MCQADSDPVKLLVNFPSQANLEAISETLIDRYFFIQCVKKSGKSQLLISFDSMSDLLEIDFIQQFGALSAKVKNSSSFCKEMHQEYHNSTSDADSSNKFINCCNNTDKFEPQNLPQLPKKELKMERLTSLQDEVKQFEEQMKKLALFDGPLTFSRLQQVGKKQENTQAQINLEFQQRQPQKEKQSIWNTVINGVAITSLLFGGVKAIKFFFS